MTIGHEHVILWFKGKVEDRTRGVFTRRKIFMPVTRTAARALRKSQRLEQHNTAIRRHVQYLMRKVKKSLEEKVAVADIEKDYRELTKALDKAAKVHLLHPNKVARLKSRTARKLNNARSPQAAEAKPVKKTKTVTSAKTKAKSSKKSKK